MSIEEISEDGWDRIFLNWSSKTAEPLCKAFELLRYRTVAPLGKFNHFKNPFVEVAFRTAIVVGAYFLAVAPVFVTAVALGVTSKVLRKIGFALQKNNYTHIRGQAPEKELDDNYSLLTWNLCGIGGGMHYDHGGVSHFRFRTDEFVKAILEADVDVLVLQEVYDTDFAEALIAKLGPHYAHFYTHLGANVMGSVGGEMVITKCAIHKFNNTSFKNNSWGLNRTFTTLEIKAKSGDTSPCARVFGTHFIDGDQKKQIEQFEQVLDQLTDEKLAELPTSIGGDFNMERDQAPLSEYLKRYLIHSYLDQEPTCTNELLRQWNPKIKAPSGETIDYISLFKRVTGDGRVLRVRDNVKMEPAKLIRAFDNRFDTNTAFCDHHGLVTRIYFK